jgi:ABC-type branched-subunit amino acid transport system ATPase component
MQHGRVVFEGSAPQLRSDAVLQRRLLGL